MVEPISFAVGAAFALPLTAIFREISEHWHRQQIHGSTSWPTSSKEITAVSLGAVFGYWLMGFALFTKASTPIFTSPAVNLLSLLIGIGVLLFLYRRARTAVIQPSRTLRLTKAAPGYRRRR
jgi:hypothetical protein